MSSLTFQLLIIAGFALVVILWIRFLPVDAPRFHVDPTQVETRNMSGSTLLLPTASAVADGVTPHYALAPHELSARLDALISSEGVRIAGTLDDDFATYVIKSKLFGFPDYVSVKIVDLGDGRSSFAIFSRLRLGRSDLGVNPKRVRRWIGELREYEAVTQ